MPGDCRPADVEPVGNLAGGAFALPELFQDVPPDPVTHGLERGV
jgi:hypothetical protein